MFLNVVCRYLNSTGKELNSVFLFRAHQYVTEVKELAKVFNVILEKKHNR